MAIKHEQFHSESYLKTFNYEAASIKGEIFEKNLKIVHEGRDFFFKTEIKKHRKRTYCHFLMAKKIAMIHKILNQVEKQIFMFTFEVKRSKRPEKGAQVPGHGQTPKQPQNHGKYRTRDRRQCLLYYFFGAAVETIGKIIIPPGKCLFQDGKVVFEDRKKVLF